MRALHQRPLPRVERRHLRDDRRCKRPSRVAAASNLSGGCGGGCGAHKSMGSPLVWSLPRAPLVRAPDHDDCGGGGGEGDDADDDDTIRSQWAACLLARGALNKVIAARYGQLERDESIDRSGGFEQNGRAAQNTSNSIMLFLLFSFARSSLLWLSNIVLCPRPLLVVGGVAVCFAPLGQPANRVRATRAATHADRDISAPTTTTTIGGGGGTESSSSSSCRSIEREPPLFTCSPPPGGAKSSSAASSSSWPLTILRGSHRVRAPLTHPQSPPEDRRLFVSKTGNGPGARAGASWFVLFRRLLPLIVRCNCCRCRWRI